jgi:hypothetical protein
VGAIKAEAGEAFLLHGGHAQRLKGRCKADSENSDRPSGQIYIRGALNPSAPAAINPRNACGRNADKP